MDRIVDAAGRSHGITALRYVHGRHGISFAPGFCGRPTVVLGSKAPDTMSFQCADQLTSDARHTLVLASGHRLKILITSRKENRWHAVVLS